MMRTAAKFLRPAGARTYAIPVRHVCREWRCKVDNEATAEKLDKALDRFATKIPSKDVRRMVCKAEWDYKVVSTVSLAGFGKWKDAAFAPEAEFLNELKATAGVTNVGAQAYLIDKKK